MTHFKRSLIIFLLVLIYFPIFSQAAVLLVPDTNVLFANYQTECKKNGYQCTYDFFQSQLASEPTPLFDNFINSVDLSTAEFKQSALNNLQNLLTKEMISEDQLDLILTFLQQLREEGHAVSKSSLLEKSLLKAKELLQKSKPLLEADQENYIIFMKKALPTSELKKINSVLLRLPYYQMNFNKTPLFKAKNQNTTSQDLAIGFCEKAQINDLIQNQHWQILNHKPCSFNEQIQKVTSAATTKISENKSWILTGALLIGAAVLMSQYEVKLQF